MRQKRRKVKPAQPGERKQFAPGELANSLDPVLRQNIVMLAEMGYAQKGRGLLMVELDDTARSGIVSAQFLSVRELAPLNRSVPFGESQPIAEAVQQYDPEREFVVSVIDTSPSLPGPQLWFDVLSREPSPQKGE